jgi:hypothetical protein
MSVIRVGSTSTYADGWEQIFGGAGRRGTAKPTTSAAKKPAKKAVQKKPAAKKAGVKKAKSRGR